LTNLNAGNLATGTIPNGRFPATLPAANGSALTSLSAGNLTGTVVDARLSGNVPLINAANVWTGVTNGFQGNVNIGVNGGGGVINVAGRGIGAGGDTILIGDWVGPSSGVTSAGPGLGVGRNSTGAGAPGMIHFVRKDGTDAWIWADTSGKIRTSATGVAPPQVDTGDTVGTVVGDQTSTLDTKRLLGDDLQPFDALDIVLHTPVRQFVYKSGAYSGSTFQGIIADWSPEFAMDPDKQHPNGRSFNPVNAFGYTVESIKALQAEIDTLRADIAELKARQ
jgi:hypothetical protein